MVIIMVMVMINIHEAKAKLSEYIKAAVGGERVLICKRNRPVVELHAVVSTLAQPRPIGGAKGRVVVPDAFFDPLPEEVVAAFYGESEETSGASRVAESSGAYKAARGRRSKGRR